MAAKNRKSWIFVTVIVVIFIIAAATIFSRLSQKIPVRTAGVSVGIIHAYVEERARTSLPHTYHITMPLQGRVLPIDVHEGERVKVGDIVARIDDIDWQDATLETVDIIRAVANWVQATEAQVKAGTIRHEYTKWEWEADSKLLESSFVSEKQERETKRRYLDSAVKIEESQALLQMSMAVQSIIEYLPKYVKRNLDRTIVSSPVTGTILKRHVWNEKVMTPGEPLLDIGNLEEIEITSDVLTEAALRIQPGDQVEIYGESLGDLHMKGVVRLVKPEAFTKISSLGVEEQRVPVKISFAEGTLETLKSSRKTLGLHYRLRVRVITDEKVSALIIPRTALFHGIKGQWQVYRVDNGKARITDVTVGIINDFETEITAGLQAGDTVIVAPDSSITDGTKVLVMPAPERVQRR